ncbi:hypothetical protein HOLleu_30846 [Holothuria leucospilota]|uniref:CCHC-type domain-containing protein n=1 Tax=Holothuria leucospilota TaxID=206669 RepID=A0A9Q1BL63_HOLLE|nr:hypothetical protein HOLleu_30846 [Holothuria leucospilota]
MTQFIKRQYSYTALGLWVTFADDEDKNDIKIIMTKLDTYFIGESNETYERYVFNKRDQQAGETVDAYVANLRNLAQTCNFGDREESLIKDILVLGINDPGTRKTLFQTRNLTLQDAVDICKTDEATRNQLKSVDTESVNKVQQKKGNGQQRDKNSVPMISNCQFCGRSHPKRKEYCPAWGKTCKNCGKKNHFAAQCKSASKSHTQNKQAKQINQLVEDNQSDDYEWINSIHTEKKDLRCRMEVNNEEVIFQVDTGATVNTLPEKYVHDSVTAAATKTLKMWNDTQVETRGKCRLIVKNPANMKKYSVEFVVTDNSFTPLLSLRAA